MQHSDFTDKDFQKATGIDDAGLDKLRRYHALLLEWNPNINLVGPSTLGEAWHRHFLDSAQLYPLIKGEEGTLLDLGSGAGFPGLVLAVMGIPNVTLVERDARKCAFLRTVAAETGTDVEILNVGAGTIEDRQFDIVTARALAELGALLNLSIKLRKPSTSCLFLKGKNLDAELTKAQKDWKMDVQRTASITDAEAFVLRLTKVEAKG